MSSSIRPPGAPGASPLNSAGRPAGSGQVGEAAPGSAPLKSQAPAAAPGSASAADAASASPSAEWLRRLDAGEVTKSQAIEGLVAEAVHASGGAQLSAAQRSELADVLRQTLLGDPVLGALLGG